MSTKMLASQVAQSRRIVIRSELIEPCGDIVVAALLSQILYWHDPDRSGKSKLRVKRNGFFWIAKTRQEWVSECGISLKQYRRALKVLKAKRLIEERVMKFSGTPMTHIRLLRENLQLHLGGPGDIPKGDTPLVPSGPIERAHSARSFTETTSENTARRSGALQCAKATKDEQLKSMQGEDNHEGVKKKEHQANGNLQLFWMSKVSASSLTAKQKGQLKMLANKLGVQVKPVIELVAKNWWKYSHEAQLSAGLTTCPPSPHIGFLLKHCGVAANMLPGSAPQLQLTADSDVSLFPPLQTEKELPHKLTADELQEILDGLSN